MTRPCPACGAADGRPFGVKDAYALVRCRACATLHTADVPSSEALHDTYASYYGEGNLTVPAFVEVRLDEIVGTFADFRRSKRLLDVGFGAGTMLHAARRAGWTASGVEVSEPAVAHARGQGFDVTQGSLADARYPDGAFDVVAAVEVLEHLTDPLALLREVARVLRPGGLFWATTPHGRGLSARILGTRWSVVSPPEHIQLFSMRGMRTLLQRAGYGGVRLAAHGVNPYELLGRSTSAADRVETSYELNEYFSTRPSRRMVKQSVNAVLSTLRLGDSLKVRAVK